MLCMYVIAHTSCVVYSRMLLSMFPLLFAAQALPWAPYDLASDGEPISFFFISFRPCRSHFGVGAMVCGLLPLGLSWASLVVFGCVMCAALRSAKARFCLLVATLTLMMAWVWAGILLAALHPVFSLALLLSLVAC